MKDTIKGLQQQIQQLQKIQKKTEKDIQELNILRKKSKNDEILQKEVHDLKEEKRKLEIENEAIKHQAIQDYAERQKMEVCINEKTLEEIRISQEMKVNEMKVYKDFQNLQEQKEKMETKMQSKIEAGKQKIKELEINLKTHH